MKHRLFNLLIVVSLILAIAVAGIWAGSYATSMTLRRFHEHVETDGSSWRKITGVLVERGRFDVGWYRNDFPASFVRHDSSTAYRYPPTASLAEWQGYLTPLDPPSPQVTFLRRLGFGSQDYTNSSVGQLVIREIWVPCWFLLLLASAMPVIWVLKHLVRHRHPAGHCRHCGYDLRATPDRCPECGHVPAEAV